MQTHTCKRQSPKGVLSLKNKSQRANAQVAASDEWHCSGPVLELMLLNIFVRDVDNGIECSMEPCGMLGGRVVFWMSPGGTLAGCGGGPMGPSGKLNKAKCMLSMSWQCAHPASKEVSPADQERRLFPSTPLSGDPTCSAVSRPRGSKIRQGHAVVS